MPKIAANRLERIAGRLLQAAGASSDEAQTIARHLIAANLAGHDSHGVIHVPGYVASVQNGHLQPGAPFEIIEESPTTTVVDGNWGFGFTVSERAMEITIEKARAQNVAATTVVRQGHVGRLTDYPLMAAEAGMVGLMTADSGRGPKSVAPFGGREPRLGTNPLCIAVPSNLDGPFYIDIATSAVPGGTGRRYRARAIDPNGLGDRQRGPRLDRPGRGPQRRGHAASGWHRRAQGLRGCPRWSRSSPACSQGLDLVSNRRVATTTAASWQSFASMPFVRWPNSSAKLRSSPDI